MTTKEATFIALLSGIDVYPFKPETVNDNVITFRLITNTAGARSQRGTSFWKARYQFDCWATNLEDSRDLRNSLVAALDCNHTDFRLSIVADDKYDYDQETGLWRSIVDVMIW